MCLVIGTVAYASPAPHLVFGVLLALWLALSIAIRQGLHHYGIVPDERELFVNRKRLMRKLRSKKRSRSPIRSPPRRRVRPPSRRRRRTPSPTPHAGHRLRHYPTELPPGFMEAASDERHRLDLSCYQPVYSLAVAAGWYAHDIAQSKNRRDAVKATFRFLSTTIELKHLQQFGEAVFNSASEVDLLGKISQSIIEDIDFTETPMEATSMVENSRKVLDILKNAPRSNMWRVSTRTVMGLLSLPLAERMGLDPSASGFIEFQKRNLRKYEFGSTYEACVSVFEMAVTMAEVGQQCYTEKSLRPILVADAEMQRFQNAVRKAMDYYDQRFVEERFDAQLALEWIQDATALGNSLMSFPDYRAFVQFELKKLLNARGELTAIANRVASRRVPFTVMLYSSPGVGKSTVTNNIVNHYHRVVTSHKFHPHLEWNPRENQYSQNFTDKFESGYQGSKHWFVLLDDLASEAPGIVATGKSQSIENVIRWVNSIGMTSNQADLADKGKIPLSPKLVIATTNTQNLNAHHAVAVPEAVLRRMPICITPVIKEEYRAPDSGQMRKLDRLVSEAWDYEIREYIIDQSTRKGTYVSVPSGPVHQDGSVPTLHSPAQMYHYLTEKIVEHERNQDVMMELAETARTREYCDICTIPKDLCEGHEEVRAMQEMLAEQKQDATFEELKKFAQEEEESPQEEFILSGAFIGAADEEESTEEPPRSEDPFERAAKKFVSWVTHVTLIVIYYFVHKLGPFVMWCQAVTYAIRTIWEGGIWSLFMLLAAAFKPEWAGSIASWRGRRLLSDDFKKIAAGLLAIAGTLIFMNLVKAAAQMACSDDEEESQPKEEAKNIWKKEDESIFLPRTQNDDGTHLKNSLRNSTLRIRVRGERNGKTVEFSQNALNLGNGSFLTTSHAFRGMGDLDIDMLYDVPSRVTPASHARISQEFLTYFGEDLVVVRTDALRISKDLRKFMPSAPWAHAGRIIVVGRTKEGEYTAKAGRISHFRRQTYHHPPSGSTFSLDRAMVFQYDDQSPTVVGDCGKAILFQTGTGWVVTGIVSAGSEQTPEGIAQLFCTQDIPDVGMMATGEDISYFVEGSGKTGPIQPMGEGKHLANWASPSTEATIIGSFSGRHRNRTRVASTRHSAELTQLLKPKDAYGPPLLNAECRDGEWVNPWIRNFEAQGKPARVPEHKLYEAARAFFGDLVSNVDCGVLYPTSLQVAINGVKGDEFINSIPMSTSGGFPAPGPKRDSLIFDPQSGMWSLPEFLLERFYALRDIYGRKERAHVLMSGHLKDEPTPVRKYEAGKSRVFTGCGVDFSVLVRQQFITHAKLFMTHNLQTECAVGMNCYSKQWEQLYQYLTKDGTVLDRSIAGDFSSFDKSMQAAAIRAAFEVLIMMSHTSEQFNEDDMLIQRGIATDLSHPVVNYNGDVFLFFGGNSSGHPLTVIINSIVNSLYMRVAYSELTGKDMREFRNDVRLITLGDDNLMVSDIDEFNHTAIQRVLAGYSIGYTMADKTSETTAFLPISETDFLKRRFRFLDGEIVAPLELESTYKSLLCYQARHHITEGEQAAQTYLAARREWALHGEEVFNEHVRKVDPILSGDEDIRCHFIDRHHLDWRGTLDWVLGREEEVEQEIEEAEIIMLGAADESIDDLLNAPLESDCWSETEPLPVPPPTLADTSHFYRLWVDAPDWVIFTVNVFRSLYLCGTLWTKTVGYPLVIAPMVEEFAKHFFPSYTYRLGTALALASHETRQQSENVVASFIRLGCHILYACVPFSAAVPMHATYNYVCCMMASYTAPMPWDIRCIAAVINTLLFGLVVNAADLVSEYYVSDEVCLPLPFEPVYQGAMTQAEYDGRTHLLGTLFLGYYYCILGMPEEFYKRLFTSRWARFYLSLLLATAESHLHCEPTGQMLFRAFAHVLSGQLPLVYGLALHGLWNGLVPAFYHQLTWLAYLTGALPMVLIVLSWCAALSDYLPSSELGLVHIVYAKARSFLSSRN